MNYLYLHCTIYARAISKTLCKHTIKQANRLIPSRDQRLLLHIHVESSGCTLQWKRWCEWCGLCVTGNRKVGHIIWILNELTWYLLNKRKVCTWFAWLTVETQLDLPDSHHDNFLICLRLKCVRGRQAVGPIWIVKLKQFEVRQVKRGHAQTGREGGGRGGG